MEKYIYERPGWPSFEYDSERLAAPLAKLHHAHGRLLGKLGALGFSVQNELLLNAVSDEVEASSEIEGETLNRPSVRSSVARRLGIEAAGLTDAVADRYTEGAVEMALDATQNYEQPLTAERLFGWHSALFPLGRSGIRRITTGAYRKDDISIVSGPIGKEKTHYKAPPPEDVPAEMEAFLEWAEAAQAVDAFTKAGIAHLWFELVHPFEDGNGRIGRAIADFLLARAEKSPRRYYSLSAQFMAERKAYYDELEAASGYYGDIGRWLVWFIGCLTRAVETSEGALESALRKTAIFDRVRTVDINKRQAHMLNLLTERFEGNLTTAKWSKINKCSHDTALRDIEALIEHGVLLRSAKGGRSTSYELAGL